MSSSKSAELRKKKDQTWEDEDKNYTLWGYTEDTEGEAGWAMLRGSEVAHKLLFSTYKTGHSAYPTVTTTSILGMAI